MNPGLSALHFRKARLEDLGQLVPLMYESSRGLIDYSFQFGDWKVEDFLAHDFRSGKGLFGYSNQFVAATSTGEIVATVTAYCGRGFLTVTLGTLISAWEHFGFVRFLKVLERMLAMSSLFKRPRADGIFIANACVAGAYRSQGIFTELFRFAIAQAKTPVIRVAEGDVSFSNPRALKFYLRLGFKVVAEYPYRGKRSLDGFRRLEMEVETSNQASAFANL